MEGGGRVGGGCERDKEMVYACAAFVCAGGASVRACVRTHS